MAEDQDLEGLGGVRSEPELPRVPAFAIRNEMLTHLDVWLDPELREGPEAMAVDEWLLEKAVAEKRAILRVYGWLGDWGTVGYFGSMQEARCEVPEVEWVRRWTGGGIVDHRDDWTYTLAVPRSERLATLRGGESYRWIHQALVAVLEGEGVDAELAVGSGVAGGSVCFDHAVEHDVVSDDFRKLAGAGQRRTAGGLLHQGTLLACGMDDAGRAAALAARLAGAWEWVTLAPPEERVRELVEGRYGNVGWTERR